MVAATLGVWWAGAMSLEGWDRLTQEGNRMTVGDDDRRPRRRRSPNVLAAALAAGTAVAITALASCGVPPSRPRHRGDLGEVFDREEETCP